MHIVPAPDVIDPKKPALTLNASVEPISRRLGEMPWAQSAFYEEWLAQTYFYVEHTVPLLALAVSRTVGRHRGLRERLLQNLREEGGHEKMLLADLRGMGKSPASFRELPATRAFYRAVYHHIDRQGPIAVVGHALVLESVAARCGELLAVLAERYGRAATTFLRVHVEEDAGHAQAGAAELASLEGPDLDVFSDAAEQAGSMYLAMLLEIEVAASR